MSQWCQFFLWALSKIREAFFAVGAGPASLIGRDVLRSGGRHGENSIGIHGPKFSIFMSVGKMVTARQYVSG